MPLSKIQFANTGRRNLIINGDIKISQRNGTTATQAVNSSYSGPDRYRFFVNGGGAYTVTQDSGHQADTGHDKALKIAVTTADTSIAAGDYYTFLQRIESNSLQHLQYGTSSAKSLTLSFWVRATKTGTQAIFFSKQGTGTDYNHIKEYTINASDTWEHKTITIPGLTASTMANDASTYLQVGWMLKYGSDFQGTKDTWTTNSHFTTANAVNNMDSTSNVFYITGAQLEVGDTATEFEHRSFDEELILCQRYYQKSYVYETAPGTATQHGSWSTGGHQGGTSTAYVEGVINFERLMRATPTITLYDHNGNSNKCARLATGVARYQNESINTSQINARGITMYSTTGTAAGIVQGHYTAQAEL